MRIDFWHSWKLNDGALMLTLLSCVLFGGGMTLGATVIRDWFGPPWFDAHVEVPNHRVGEDPEVRYERSITRNMQGLWTVEVLKNENGGWREQCQGDGLAPYSVTERGVVQMRLSTYTGIDVEDCITEPGLYLLQTAWSMTDQEGTSPRLFWDESNIFEVTE
jgi:hypothetical protein